MNASDNPLLTATPFRLRPAGHPVLCYLPFMLLTKVMPWREGLVHRDPAMVTARVGTVLLR
jgi:hypothetical protein